MQQLLTFLSICLTLGTSAIASRAASPKPANTTSSSYSYLLQTHVVHDGAKEFDSLYVQSYHTGAGLNDVALTKSKDRARRGQLLNGVQYFNGSGFPETFFLPYGISYDGMFLTVCPICDRLRPHLLVRKWELSLELRVEG